MVLTSGGKWVNRPLFTWKGNADHCVSGKFDCLLGMTKNSTVPKWSRPVENMGHRNPDWNSTSIVIVPGDQVDQHRDLGPRLKARPIKHWRKQLAPRVTSGQGKTSIGMPMDIPAGSIYLDSSGCCDVLGNSFHLSTYIPKLPQYVSDLSDAFLNVKPSCNPINPVFNKPMCCNPQKNVIKSAVTLLKKDYYTDSRAYLKARCRTYEQRLSGTQVPGNHYYDGSNNAWPSDDPKGSQVRAMKDCYEACVDSSNNCYGAPKKSIRATTIYKPSNAQFAVQGAVSSSTRLDRLKLNTIQRSAAGQRSAWGDVSARAAAYSGKAEAPYFLKSKYSGDIRCKSIYRRRGNHTLCFNTPCGILNPRGLGGGGSEACHRITGRLGMA